MNNVLSIVYMWFAFDIAVMLKEMLKLRELECNNI
jgi:hypothetical protein